MGTSKTQTDTQFAALRGRLIPTSYTVAIICFGLFAYGTYADFIASETWSLIGLFIAFPATGLVAMLAVYSYRAGIMKFKEPPTFFQCLVLIPLVTGIFWVAIVHGAGALVTNIYGPPIIEIKTEATRERGVGTHRAPECDYQLNTPALDGAFPHHICISKRQHNMLDDVALVHLAGFRSSLGFSIRYIRVDDGPK